MRHNKSLAWSVIAIVLLALGFAVWPATASAPTLVGRATAAKVTTLDPLGGTPTALADTGPLPSTGEAQGASELTAGVPSVLSGEVLNAATIGGPDQVDSEASLANLTVTVGAVPISAEFVMARATSMMGAPARTAFVIDNLSINGVPIQVTGAPNQTVPIPGGSVVINEQQVSPVATTVSALHATVFGVTDVVVASATAGIR